MNSRKAKEDLKSAEVQDMKSPKSSGLNCKAIEGTRIP